MLKKDNCRICRRAGEKLFLKGDKCASPKCPFVKRSYAPGQAGAKARTRRGSDFSIQLAEKQKARAIYGVGEAQMRKYFDQARKIKGGTSERLMQILEARVDNVAYRTGWFVSRDQARQAVSHGQIKINQKGIKTPSHQIKIGEVVEIGNLADKKVSAKNLPKWLKLSADGKQVELTSLPEIGEIQNVFDIQLITEFYSR